MVESPVSAPSRGALISLEGGEGAGKTTVLVALRARLEARGHAVVRKGFGRARILSGRARRGDEGGGEPQQGRQKQARE